MGTVLSNNEELCSPTLQRKAVEMFQIKENPRTTNPRQSSAISHCPLEEIGLELITGFIIPYMNNAHVENQKFF